MILTRFSRVTFNAAHRYLGLTSELLRAEKGINDLARHPLPRGFYEGGGLNELRARFPQGSSLDMDMEDEETVIESGDEGYFAPRLSSSKRERETDGT